MSEPRPDTEREWLEGLRYEDKFPEPRPDTAALVEMVREALHYRPLEYQQMGQDAHAALTALVERLAEAEAALERITNQAERSIEPENHVAASWVAAHARAALRSLRGETT